MMKMMMTTMMIYLIWRKAKCAEGMILCDEDETKTKGVLVSNDIYHKNRVRSVGFLETTSKNGKDNFETLHRHNE